MEQIECMLPLAAELPSCDDRIAALHRYWRSIRPAAGVLPGRQHFDPAEIPRLLSCIRLYDVHRDPLRFKYRVIGTELVRIIGHDPTGHWLHERFPHVPASSSYRHLIAVAESQGIGYRRGFPVHIVPKDFLTTERIFLPLARDGRVVDMVIGLTIHHPTSPFAARPPFAAEA